jgi:hypothetical protein
MGNIKSSQKYVEVNMNDCNVGKITNYNDVKELELFRNSLPNHFTGYTQNMSLKISDYIKYDNGMYLYISRSILVRYLFDMEKCFMVNNFKVQNENVKMYIQLDERMKGQKKCVNLYESVNFVVRDGNSCHLVFAFVSKHKIEDEFIITADKLLAGPQSFINKLQDHKLHIHIKNGSQLGAKKVTFLEMIERERHRLI